MGFKTLMGFKTQSIRQWEREWRQSDWRETIPLSSGRECPECLATICSGKSWRAHWLKHEQDAERFERMDRQLRLVSRVARLLAEEAGHSDWYPARNEPGGEDQEAREVTGIVVGSGELPAEMRGGDG